MKQIAILAVVATVALTGCNNKATVEPADDVVGDARPMGVLAPELTMGEEPVISRLSDDQIDPILGEPATTPTEAISSIRPAHPAEATHLVQKGDTLWSLAVRYLGSGQRWREIADANPGLQPQRLATGKAIRIPPR